MDDQGASSPTPQGRWMAARAVSNRLARLRKPRKALRASVSRARIGRRYRETRIAASGLKGRQAKTCTLNAERPARGSSPLRAFSAHIEKRPPRARRPALPQPGAAVLSAKAGLTAGFGMGPGDPRLCGRARGGRSPAALKYSSLPGTPHRGDPGGRMAGTGEDSASRSVLVIEDAKSSGY